jgi:hypothetical protein
MEASMNVLEMIRTKAVKLQKPPKSNFATVAFSMCQPNSSDV